MADTLRDYQTLTSISSRLEYDILVLDYWCHLPIEYYLLYYLFHSYTYPNIFTRYTSIKIGTLASANQTEYPETYSASGSYIYHYNLHVTCIPAPPVNHITHLIPELLITGTPRPMNFRRAPDEDTGYSCPTSSLGENWRGIVSLGGGDILRCIEINVEL